MVEAEAVLSNCPVNSVFVCKSVLGHCGMLDNVRPELNHNMEQQPSALKR